MLQTETQLELKSINDAISHSFMFRYHPTLLPLNTAGRVRGLHTVSSCTQICLQSYI